MNMSFVNGGLGNQVFQYIFTRYMEEETGRNIFLEDTYFFNCKAHNGFEIHKVFPNSKVKRLSDNFDPDVWEHILSNQKKGIDVINQFLDLGEDMHLVGENLSETKTITDARNMSNTIFETNGYHPSIINLQNKNIYYLGYWINKNWLYSGKGSEKIFKELEFHKIVDRKNLEYQKNILNTESVLVHVRRGDFVTLGWCMGTAFYKQAIGVMRKEVTKKVIVNQCFLFFQMR